MGRVAEQAGLRIAQGLFVALGVSTLTFCLLMAMPGDLATNVALARYGEDGLNREKIEHVRQQTGLSRSTTRLYADWVGSMFSSNLGYSMVTGEPVLQAIGFHLRMSLVLGFTAILFSTVIAFPVGIWAGIRPGSAIDFFSAVFSSLVISLPSFVLGAFLIMLFSIKLRMLPAAGFFTADSIILPALTLGIALSALSCRVIRTAVADVRNSSYLQFARLKGLSGNRIFIHHGIRSGAVPIITFLALQLAHVLDGVVVLENLFNWPGVGFLLLESIRGRDLTMIQGVTLIIGLIYVLLNLVADLVCAWLDPRQLIRSGDDV